MVGDPITTAFIIAGDANLDAYAGDGQREAMIALLDDPRLQDPKPLGNSPRHAMDTVDWSEPTPGNMRVDYVLPSTHWQVINSGVVWPKSDDPIANTVAVASRHRLVWVDLIRD